MLGLVIALSVALNYGILRTLVFPSFVELEQAEARENLERVQNAIGNELNQIAGTNGDWAHWDDTYEFAAGRNQSYIDENVSIDFFAGMGLNVVYVLNLEGKVLVGDIYDFENWETIEPEGFLLDNLPQGHWLTQFDPDDLATAQRFVIQTSVGPVLMTAGAILNNESEGPMRGTLVMGRILDQANVDSIQERTKVDFQVWTPAATDIAAEDQREFSRPTRRQAALLSKTGPRAGAGAIREGAGGQVDRRTKIESRKGGSGVREPG